MEQAIRAFAKHQRIKPEDYEAFKAKVLLGLRSMGLPNDKIDEHRYKAIAGRKDAQALAKKQEEDANGKQTDETKSDV